MTEQLLPLHTSALTSGERSTYAAIADELIPNGEGMPSASDADVPTRWVEDALRYRPDLLPPLREALAIVDGLAARYAVELLHAQHVPLFDAVGTLTAGAYFLNPEIKSAIGYPGQVSTPLRDDSDEYLELLANVVERGPIYREVPGEKY